MKAGLSIAILALLGNISASDISHRLRHKSLDHINMDDVLPFEINNEKVDEKIMADLQSDMHFDLNEHKPKHEDQLDQKI